MALFGKKNKEEQTSCGCGCDCGAEKKTENVTSEASGVKVLGSGCAKCNQLEAATKEALAQMGMDTAIEHVTDFAQIAVWGVMTTPALVVDGKLLSYGKVLKKDQVLELLKKARG